ncbi:MAG: hypothetical protein U0800_08245 [Isosphaeraceae bacterium]
MSDIESQARRSLRIGLPSIPAAPEDLTTWRGALSADARNTLARGRWPAAFLAIGWIHLAYFVVLQLIDDNQPHSDLRHPLVWILELLTILGVLTWAGGLRWFAASPAVSVFARLWGTFLILSFNLSAMNAQTGWSMNWYKPVWANLSAFLFAMLGSFFQPRYFLLACLMFVTGLAMLHLPDWDYLIYGVSWWICIEIIGIGLLRRKRVDAAKQAGTA